ncbi:ArsB/NhaD family transporter [Halalkalibacterium halodurans]|jgi:Na+/H+ antiporter NhaD/arsenite permease-like protein|uniref:BH1231 protein n=2 Tax=Halalkalibacterium halodurans TaxID=86665 RepID=Q9KDI2_HALH5|nr:ArsB/NhaD family transporter [Halalkalibacterium halodurans]MDY7221754.1 ArsB/NhaD family transporter [Halalkalibacterium halodurans]MDY7241030.1 ArsB/NhaD family transporter [Halalkalibacterium halodurans]MED3645557.1 ArsB/NhaD family transporter [Halalkalibacterium halodurans]MED4079428.1 ArsB/NhaD family transporter [Halalkalibacterium halodurans]MED4086550.1 ArsB/NhaD family transporter [Halalkalibacterium halodurans]
MELTLALVIFVICYLLIMAETFNRAVVACLGGVLMLFVGIYPLDAAFLQYIDWHTITLLLSMMILVSITSQSGFFEYMAIRLAQKVDGRPIPLLIVVAGITAIGSAFLNNVTMVLLIVPIVLTLTNLLKLNAVPFLLTLVMASNIGGTATLIGDPPNLMIGQAVAHLSFNDFLLHLGPIVAVIFFVVLIGLILYYRRQLSVTAEDRSRLRGVDPTSYLKNRPLLIKSMTVLTLTTIGFTIQPFLPVELTSIAMAGALLLMLITQNEQDMEGVFRSVEWVTLFFFIGLFMLVGGIKEVGIIDEIAKAIIYYTEGDIPKTSLFILWGSGILSGFVDNIPFVAAMIPVILEFQEYGVGELDPLWWSLALGACLGGNATVIGATANVIVAGLAVQAKQSFSYLEFLKVGAPVALVSFLLCTVYLYIRYLIYF